MNTSLIIIIVVNILYLSIWFAVYKIRCTKNSIIREWDNGNEFYEMLDDTQKEAYWKEDTKIVNIFLCVFLLFLESSFILFYLENILWIPVLILGFLIAFSTTIVLSIKCRKKYRR